MPQFRKYCKNVMFNKVCVTWLGATEKFWLRNRNSVLFNCRIFATSKTQLIFIV